MPFWEVPSWRADVLLRPAFRAHWKAQMAPEDVQLAGLVKAAVAARGRQIALGIKSRTKVATSVEAPTSRELAEIAAAEAACAVADAALADFQARYRWTAPRD
jgi:hypothetical protein